jgi:3'-phosphoadenosine 5'-phosphosulfate sulfotransferase (PAPS reductase)/FAD synthetase
MNIAELRERQSWTLEQKIDHSLGTIESFVNRMGGEDKVYVSFSGGKDSTVLYHLARRLYPNILGVFCNTGNEYPDIIRFVRQTQSEGANIKIIRPKITPREVWEKYGFPLVSKQVSQRVHAVRLNPYTACSVKYMGDGFFSINKRWRYLVSEPYETSDQCCDKLKKEPFHRFEKESGRSPILGIMACESVQRERLYINRGGCNVFRSNAKSDSQPMAIWLENDVWNYIRRFKLPIAEIYNKGLDRTGCFGCGFGSYRTEDERFKILLREYPKCYDMVMNYTNNGVTFREALRKALAVNGIYLPDEQPPTLFDIIND